MDYSNLYERLSGLADRIISQSPVGDIKRADASSLVNRPRREVSPEEEGLDPETKAVGMFSSVRQSFLDPEMVEEIKKYTSKEELPESAPEQEQTRPVARPDTPIAADVSERELLAKTLHAEAAGEGYEGMLAAGTVIANRVDSGKYGGNTLRGVILKPGQFSAWNLATGYAKGQGGLNMDKIKPSEAAYKAADDLLSGKKHEAIGDRTHYYAPKYADPRWGKRAGGDWLTIGNHVFGWADAGKSKK